MQSFLPPKFVALATLASVAFGLVVPITGPGPWWMRVLGVVVFLAGVALNVSSAARFDRIGTNIKTFNDPEQLVTDGAFAVTRNPMYVGFTMILAGVALIVATASAWVGAIAFFIAANWWYIPFEERRAADVFGSAYEAYRSRVPRWVGPVRKQAGVS